MKEEIKVLEEMSICSNLISEGKSLEDWIDYFQNKKIIIAEYVKEILKSNSFQPTNRAVYQTALIKGVLFKNGVRFYETIKSESEVRNLLTANIEAFFLTIDKFSREKLIETGLHSIVLVNKLELKGEFFVLDYDGTYLSCWPIPSTTLRFFGWNENNSFLFLNSFISQSK